MIDLDRFDDTPFFSFFRPVFEFINEGKHLSIVYSIIHFAMALLNLLLPFIIIYNAIKWRIFSQGAKIVFAFIFMWLVVVFACWIGFQFWWDRRKKATDAGSPDFLAMPLASEILQTMGECMGIQIAIIGVGGGLASIFFAREVSNLLRRYFSNMIGYYSSFLSFGVSLIIVGPLIGIAFMCIFRFFAELVRVLAAIANK